MTGNLRLNISMKYDPDQCCISGKWMRLHASFNYLFCKENYYTKNAIWHPMLYIRAYLTRFYQVQLRWEWGNRVIKNRRCWCNDFPGSYAFFSRLYPGVSSYRNAFCDEKHYEQYPGSSACLTASTGETSIVLWLNAFHFQQNRSALTDL